MKITSKLPLLAALGICAGAAVDAAALSTAGQPYMEKPAAARFDYFEYTGLDERFDRTIDPGREYFNPILAGFYPDPSICRKGDDYFLITSTFSYVPGIPIFHSRDLVNWRQLGYVLDRPSQLDVEGIRLSGGIYAPAITYNKHNDTFYIVTTAVDGIGNFVVKTDDPLSGVWSDPIPLPNVGGIDPALFFDDDGRGYLVHNDAPEVEPEYDGHRAIWIYEYDPATDTTGRKAVLVDGGVDKSMKPVWIEGPHIYKVGGRYLLMAAEGGTSINHTEVIFSSDNVWGPYVPYPGNPILSQRGLPEPRPDIVTSVGHADLIETAEGDWYAVFLGVRPYEGNHYNTGRETFLLPVRWVDGFPIILDKDIPVPTVVEKPGLIPAQNYVTGNFTWRDDFDSDDLAMQWSFIRNPRGEWWTLRGGALEIQPIGRSIFDVDNPAFIGRRQQHTEFMVTTRMTFTPTGENDLAGLVCYQRETHNIVFGKTVRGGEQVIIVQVKNGDEFMEFTSPIFESKYDSPVILKINGGGGECVFTYSFDGHDWDSMEGVSNVHLSTESAGGFTGVMLGMYASSAHEIPALKKIYADYFTMGVAVEHRHLAGQEPAMIKKHFGSVTAEKDMKAMRLLSEGGEYTFEAADVIRRFARRNGMKMRGHTLVWHKHPHPWFFVDAAGNPLSKEESAARLEKYITDVVLHFVGDVYCWDVVNEAVSDLDGELYRSADSPFWQVLGPDYIELAFRTAHQANPELKLFYNDYNLTSPAKRDKVYELVKGLLEKGVPVHGIGMQGHYSIEDITREDLQAAIDKFASLGVELHVTELDLTVYGNYHGDEAVARHTADVKEFTPVLSAEHSEKYAMIFDVLRRNSDKITNVTFWGLADNYTWLGHFPVPGRTDHPLVFDRNYEPKDAFWSIVKF